VLRSAALPERQDDREELVLGPPKAAGEGAAAGFARKQGIEPADLRVETTAKGEYFAAVKKIAGREVREILAEALPGLITKIPWPKTMYWTGKDGIRFIRPIRWIAAMLGDVAVEFELAGVKSGALTHGHRRLGADEIVFDHANYEERLEKNGVILSADKRKKRILDGIKKLLRGTGLKLVEDAALLDDLCYLTEYPTPILGDFDSKFLDLPVEVLTMVMRHHQRYFTLHDAEGNLAPKFVAVMNMKADRKGLVKKGNERVIEARFNDARFFWEVDQHKKLADRVQDLAHVTYQAKLGSYLDKTNRMLELARELNFPEVFRAIQLSKCDLTTEMVKEFTDLQGVVGGLYARLQGEAEGVWRAIYDQYKPASMEDAIPVTREGQILSLVDRWDALTGCFSIGLIPSGSRDPFALRRAAQGVVRILVEGKHRFLPPRPTPELWEFFLDRVRYYFRDVRGFAYDEVNAVLAGQWADLVDVEARLLALRQVRQTENFEPLAAAFKRIRNILKQAEWRYEAQVVDSTLLDAAEERALNEESGKTLAYVAERRKSDDYMEALSRIAALRPVVDHFFDKVLVNAPDERVRANRLALLGRLFTEVSAIADFSEIVTSNA